MKRIIFLVVLAVSFRILVAQNITAVEYFTDTDPGFGNGIPVGITPAPEINDFTFSVDITGESDGFHTLYIRARDANGFWSPVFSRPFYKFPEQSLGGSAVNITKVEYFIDADPGYSAGVDVPVTSAQSISNSFIIPLTSVSNGFHTLCVRTMDENGNWSPVYSKPFYKLSAESISPVANITRIEYFINNDPGYGAATEVPFTAAQVVSDLTFAIPLAGLPEGEHTVTVRALDANGNWSLLNSQTFALCNHAGSTAYPADAITSSGFTASWTESPGSVSYKVELSADNFETLMPGYNPLIVNSPSTSAVVTGLDQATTYRYRVTAVGTCASVASNVIELTTLITAPSVQPTDLSLTSVGAESYTVYFTPASGSPSGYLVIRQVGSSPTFVPENNISYASGQVIGDAQVAYVGADALFTETGLSPETRYYYAVFAYNENGSQISYLQTSPLENSFTTLAMEPVRQPQDMHFSAVSYDGFQVSFVAPVGGADGYIVLRRAGAPPTSVPADGTVYTVMAGTDHIAYVGPASDFADDGLNENTPYYYAVYAYNGSGESVNYLTASPLQGNHVTSIRPPVFGSPSNIGQDQFTIHWTPVTGAVEYHLDVSQDNFVTMLTGFDDLAVTGTSFAITGLQAGVAYQYRMRAVSGSGAVLDSEVVEQYTLPPTPSLLEASDIGQNGFTLHWTPATGASDYFIDVSEASDFSSLVQNYDNKAAGDATSAIVDGLNSGMTYYYRVRAANSAGMSPASEPAGSVLLLPPTPLALDATNATSTSFKAKWEAVPDISEYVLDVTLASDNFNPSIPAYTNKSVSGLTEELVTDLTPNTAYKYRVRAVNATGASPSSLPVSVSTLEVGSSIPLTLTTPVYDPSFHGLSSDISVEVQGGTPPYTVSFHYRGVTQTGYNSRMLTSSAGATYHAEIDGTIMDEIGLEFYFKVTDVNGLPKETIKHYIYQSVPAEGITIPFTASGGTGSSYEIFSIPYALEDNLIASVFDELGEYVKSRWRLVRYQAGRNVDFGAGINRIELGNGYWFNRKENIGIKLSGGTVARVNQATDAVIRLEPGWNQIGNPLPFDVDWDDVLAANPSVDLIGNLKVFNPDAFHLNDESNQLRTWSGGFVHNGNSNIVDLKLPVVLKGSAGGRRALPSLPGSRLDQPEWFVPIAVTQGAVESKVSGVGMHPYASSSIDRFDDLVVPRFLNYLEFYTRHDEYFTPKFSRDIVPTAGNHTWSFQFESNRSSEPVIFSWDPQQFGNNDAELFLFDVSESVLVDMRATATYQFVPSSGHSFRIMYGSERSDLHPGITTLGKSYPNPFTSATTIPFMIAADESKVTVEVVDVLGKHVATLVNGACGKGLHETKWYGTDDSGEPVSDGLYLYRLHVGRQITTARVIKK